MENEANPRWMWQAAIRPGCKVGYEMEAYGGVVKWGSPKHPKLDHFSIETRGYAGLCGAMRGYAGLCGAMRAAKNSCPSAACNDLSRTASFYTQKLLHRASFYIEKRLHRELLHTEAFTHRSFSRKQAFTHGKLLNRATFYTKQRLHRASFYTKQAFTQSKLLRRATLYTQKAFTERSFCTLHTRKLLHREFHTERLLHRAAFTQRLLHREAFAHRTFYTEKLWHTEVSYHKMEKSSCQTTSGTLRQAPIRWTTLRHKRQYYCALSRSSEEPWHSQHSAIRRDCVAKHNGTTKMGKSSCQITERWIFEANEALTLWSLAIMNLWGKWRPDTMIAGYWKTIRNSESLEETSFDKIFFFKFLCSPREVWPWILPPVLGGRSFRRTAPPGRWRSFAWKSNACRTVCLQHNFKLQHFACSMVWEKKRSKHCTKQKPRHQSPIACTRLRMKVRK